MNRSGVLLDTGPLVALLSKNDNNHREAQRIFSETAAPFRCCEAVVAEACFLMRKVDVSAPAEVIALGRKGVYEMSISLADEWKDIEGLLRKYADRPISLADASLIRIAEIHDDGRIVTFDADFHIYRWAGNRKFQIL